MSASRGQGRGPGWRAHLSPHRSQGGGLQTDRLRLGLGLSSVALRWESHKLGMAIPTSQSGFDELMHIKGLLV